MQMRRIFTIVFFCIFIFGAITRYCSSEAFCEHVFTMYALRWISMQNVSANEMIS